VENVAGDVNSKRLEVRIADEGSEEEVIRMMEQIGYPVGG
jgi:hypothetical protein